MSREPILVVSAYKYITTSVALQLRPSGHSFNFFLQINNPLLRLYSQIDHTSIY